MVIPAAVVSLALRPILAVFAAPAGSDASPEPPRGFAIVAPEAWLATLEPLAKARAAEWDVELASIERILEAPLAEERGLVDAPERLKRHLFEGWRERGLRFVLLVGDADVLPVRFMVLDRATEAAFHTAFYASDLYYADVANESGAFESWNGAAEGHHGRWFGEVRGESIKDGPINFDRISYVPELAVGRWPVSDAATLAAVIEKTLSWKPSGELPRVLGLHAPGWIDARPRAAAILDRLGAAGFETQRQFFGEEGGGPDPDRVGRALAAGVALAFHLGHGSPGAWEHCLAEPQLTSAPDYPPAVYFSIGCNTAEFCAEPPYQAYLDESGLLHRGTNQGEVFRAPPPPPAPLQPGPLNATGLGERLLRSPRGGAVAYIGCNTGAQPCALTLLEGFTGALAADPTLPIGAAWRDALAHYARAERLAELVPTTDWYPPSIFFQGMKFMLFGDPTLRLAAGRAGS